MNPMDDLERQLRRTLEERAGRVPQEESLSESLRQRIRSARHRRRGLVASAALVVVAVAAGALAIRNNNHQRVRTAATSPNTVDCGAEGAPDFLRLIAFDSVVNSQPRPKYAQYVKTTRSGAQSVASDPNAVVPQDEPAYLLQITGGSFEIPRQPSGGSSQPATVLTLTISIASEFTTDAGYTDRPADLAALGPVNQFSLDPSCADGSLFVVQHQTACCFTEGQISYLELTTTTGDVVASRAFAALGSSVAVVDLQLQPGRYHIRSWQRPCSASCPPDPHSDQMLGAVTDECASDVDVALGERQERTIQFAPSAGCTVIAGAASLDVPAAVTLRPEVRGCGTDFSLDNGARASAQQCLLDAFENGSEAEAMAYEPGVDPGRPRFVIRSTTKDGIVVFERADPDVGPWTRTRCSRLERGSDGNVVATGCGPPEQL